MGAHTTLTKQACHICEKTDHVLSTDKNNKTHVDYFSCKVFVEMSPKERRSALQKKGFCLQCLTPGMKYDVSHTCYKKYSCPDAYHNSFPKGLHILVCEAHKKKQGNLDLLEEYKKNFISKRSNNFETFTKNISLFCQNDAGTSYPSFKPDLDKLIANECNSAIFMLQTINVDGHKFNLFYDTGCSNVVIKKSAVDKLLSIGRARHEVRGPITLSGVGGQVSECPHGEYSFCLPLKNGYNAVLGSICLDQVTVTFPRYALQRVQNDIRRSCKRQGGEDLLKKLPKLSSEVGGDTDILIGSRYLKYHPKIIWSSPTGLCLLESCFFSADGTTGVIGGPHAAFTEAERLHRNAHGTPITPHGTPINCVNAYFSSPLKWYRDLLDFTADVPMLGQKFLHTTDFETKHFEAFQPSPSESSPCERAIIVRRPPKCVKVFDEVESVGTEVTYRCSSCRNCQECKKSLRLDNISIQEEIEQELISRSVQVDISRGETISVLPFVVNPDPRLKPNEKLARKIYESQSKILSNKPIDKEAVLLSESKLQELGFVEYFDNLPQEDKNMILKAPSRYFIPWRAVWNENSLSTPCRVVFDASICPRGGCGLNSLLAKGANNMNSLIQILIRWSTHKHVYHIDIKKCITVSNWPRNIGDFSYTYGMKGYV